ncbi:DEBR0S2_13916g1_1 [Brettanomyces bruxellensis]|uniref:DEBR0S2_13916g1_1 n=1 Tax=Dekkera bruxellensis TaxID=5007 RepID=A0A7D9H0Q5_DEKBR|nr:DEBR0S2_13916g1_1 [Brettanomyces bruxellensis]
MSAQFPNISSNDVNTVKLPPISFLAGSMKNNTNSEQRDGGMGTGQSTFPASFSGFRSGNQLRLPSISSLASGFQQSTTNSESMMTMQSAVPAGTEQKGRNRQPQFSSFPYSARQPGYFPQPNTTNAYQTSNTMLYDVQPDRVKCCRIWICKERATRKATTAKQQPQQKQQTQQRPLQQQQQQQHLKQQAEPSIQKIPHSDNSTKTHNTHHNHEQKAAKLEQHAPGSNVQHHHQPHHHYRHKSEDLGERIKEAQSLLKDGGHIHIVHEPHGDHHHHKVYVHNPGSAEHALASSSSKESHKSGKENGASSTVQKPAIANESNSTVQNDSTIAENSTTMNQTTILDQSMLLASQPFHKRKVTVSSRDILNIAAGYPRKRIGSVIYTDYPTYPSLIRHWKNLSEQDTEKLALDKARSEEVEKQRKEYGILVNKRVELLPSLISHYTNCTIDVYVPYHEMFDNSNVYDKRIWGTDVYTDDSDIVAILYHCGILHSQDPTRRKVRKISKRQEKEQTRDLDTNATSMNYQFTSYSGPITPGNSENLHNITGSAVSEEAAADLIVTLVILPTLKEYKGCYRNNYYSRSWKNHDGCSIAVYGVRWCKLGEGINFSGVSRYGAFRKKMLNERLEIAQKVRDQKDPEQRLDANSGNSQEREKAGQWTGGRKFSHI